MRSRNPPALPKPVPTTTGSNPTNQTTTPTITEPFLYIDLSKLHPPVREFIGSHDIHVILNTLVPIPIALSRTDFDSKISNTDLHALLAEHTAAIQDHLNKQTNLNVIQELLQNFQEKLLNVNVEKLNDFDRKSIELFSNMQSNLIRDLATTLDSHTMHHKITTINDTLTSLHNNFTGNSSQKGKMSENMLFHNILKAFPDSDVVLTRDQKESCDIQIKRDGRPTILIDSKHCEFSNVRKSDLDKFYDDCKLNDSCGILCNAFGGIANKKHFEIDIQDKRVYVFIANHQFDSTTFQLAARVIYNVYDIIKEKKVDGIYLDNQLYQRLKIEYNFFLQSFHQHLDNIRANINSLSQLTFMQLDNFFKRSNFSTDLKPFSCHLCGTGCGSAKTLNKHLKDKHPTFVPEKTKNSKSETDPTKTKRKSRKKSDLQETLQEEEKEQEEQCDPIEIQEEQQEQHEQRELCEQQESEDCEKQPEEIDSEFEEVIQL